MVIFIWLFVAFALVAIACGVWQINLAINHKEKYAALQVFKKDYEEEQIRIGKGIASGVLKVVEVATKVAKRK